MGGSEKAPSVHKTRYISTISQKNRGTENCEQSNMKMIFYFHANKIHFQKKGFEFSLVLKVRVFELGNGLS